MKQKENSILEDLLCAEWQTWIKSQLGVVTHGLCDLGQVLETGDQ